MYRSLPYAVRPRVKLLVATKVAFKTKALGLEELRFTGLFLQVTQWPLARTQGVRRPSCSCDR